MEVDTPFDEHAYVLAGYKQFLDNGQIKTSPIEEFYDVNWCAMPTSGSF